MKYFDEILLQFHCVRFSSIKKLCLQRKGILENLTALKTILLVKQEQKKLKITKMYLNETRFENQEQQKCMCYDIFRTSID